MQASHIMRLLYTAVVVALCSSAAPTTKPAPSRKPVASVLLDPRLSSTPDASLFEEQVTHIDTATLVERTDVDKVLQEQQLQALFSPDSTAQRAKIGNLLKADVLALLHPAKINDNPAIEIILCETRQGLRIHRNTIPLTKDGVADANALVDAFQAGLRRFQQPITALVAVPPLLSKDLSFEFESNQSAYQKLLEQSLTRHAGLLLIELDEARAITDELSLTTGDISRKLPLYFTGDFRNETANGVTTVTITLTLKQGKKTLDTKSESEIPLAKAPAFIQSTADALLIKATGEKALAPVDPAAESAQLNDRAMQFYRIGNYREALALSEASLLLNPQQLDIHYRAAECIRRVIGRAPVPASDRETLSRLWRNGMNHAVVFAASTPIVSDKNSLVPLTFSAPTTGLLITPDELREYVFRIFRAKSAAKVHDATPSTFADCPVW